MISDHGNDPVHEYGEQGPGETERPNSLTISDWIVESHERSVRKGFWSSQPNLSEKLMLIVSELSEAMEELRNTNEIEYLAEIDYFSYNVDQPSKPSGFATELADAAIRIFDLCGYLGIDLQEALTVKSIYNETRPYKHGRVF